MSFLLILRIGGLLTLVTMVVSSFVWLGTALVLTVPWTVVVVVEWVSSVLRLSTAGLTTRTSTRPDVCYVRVITITANLCSNGL